MDEILKITESASRQIEKIFKIAPKGTEGVSISIDKAGCNGYSYKLDFAKKFEVDDFDIINKSGIKIFIDPKATIFLIGSEMDYQTDKISSKFVFNNPNAKGQCGCGESFNV